MTMDNLARDAMLARQAGLSYGQWKAMQEPVKPVKEKIPEGWYVCRYCGKPFKPRVKRTQKYCEWICMQRAQREREKRRKAERSAMA
jgi:hypothetical protein